MPVEGTVRRSVFYFVKTETSTGLLDELPRHIVWFTSVLTKIKASYVFIALPKH